MRFCRYADPRYALPESGAEQVLALETVAERFRQFGLELHPEKTLMVDCKEINRQGDFHCVQFMLLDHTFRPRKAVDKRGRVYGNLAPAVSGDVLNSTGQTIRGWHLQLKCDKNLADLSASFNPILRGWHQYYSRF